MASLAEESDALGAELERAYASSFQAAREFLCEMLAALIPSLYAGAPFQRVTTALDALQAIVTGFSRVASTSAAEGIVVPTLPELKGALDALSTPSAILQLINQLLAAFPKIRQGAFCILVGLPAPLPGLDTADAIERLVAFAMTLCESTRLRDSEGGAMILRLVHKIYVLQHGWRVTLLPAIAVEPTTDSNAANASSSDRRSLLFFAQLMQVCA
jgi:hypothetical protein